MILPTHFFTLVIKLLPYYTLLVNDDIPFGRLIDHHTKNLNNGQKV